MSVYIYFHILTYFSKLNPKEDGKPSLHIKICQIHPKIIYLRRSYLFSPKNDKEIESGTKMSYSGFYTLSFLSPLEIYQRQSISLRHGRALQDSFIFLRFSLLNCFPCVILFLCPFFLNRPETNTITYLFFFATFQVTNIPVHFNYAHVNQPQSLYSDMAYGPVHQAILIRHSHCLSWN